MALKEFMRKYKFTYFLGKIYRLVETKLKNMIFEFGAWGRQHGIGTKKYRKLLETKNLYLGERCFIIATGPSLTTDDIQKLRYEYTFSMNSMCLKYDELNWTPTFYGVQDARVFRTVKEHIDNKNVKYCFVDIAYKEENNKQDNWVYFPRNSYYNAYDTHFKHKYHAKFSDNAVAEVYEGFTITCSLIQIAVYMGFKEIYLIGCDCNYTSNHAENHFVSHGIIDPTYKEAKDRMIAGYEAAKKYADCHDVKIYNATRGGMLEVFERVSLEEINLKKSDEGNI